MHLQRMHCRMTALIVLSGASLLLNMCANVPDSATPEICQSLMKTVGFKTYLIGEREVRTHARARAPVSSPRLLSHSC